MPRGSDRKQLVVNYISELFGSSALTSVTKIVSASDKRRKFWKCLVLFGSISGFLYQASNFLNIYWSYPIIVDYQVIFPTEVKLPALTVCNYNGLNRKEFCSAYPERCESPPNTTEFCEAFPHICEFKGNTYNVKIPKYDYRLLERYADKETVMDFGQRAEDIILSCDLLITEKRYECPNVSSFVNFYEDIPRICHTINARYREMKDLPMIYVDNELAEIELTLDLQPENYFRPDRPVYAALAIHSPDVIADPFDEGIVVESGISYEMRPTEEITRLLPSPYSSNCSDSADLPDGLQTIEGCIDHCRLKAYYEQCSCLKSLTTLPDSRRLCENVDEKCIKEADVKYCNDVCKRPCMFTSYTVNIEERRASKFYYYEKSVAEWIKHQRKEESTKTFLRIILQHPHITTKTYLPKYEFVEIFSNIGGYVGIWLGMSLIALIDFLEALLMIVIFCCRQLKRKNLSPVINPVWTKVDNWKEYKLSNKNF